MIRGDIVGGLKIALSRGDSLQKAMQSFYNSGYTKEEIEEAARTLKVEGFKPKAAPIKPRINQTIKQPKHPEYCPPIKTAPMPVIQKKPFLAQTQNFLTPPAQKHPVSSYGQEKEGVDAITILLIIVLVLLLGILVGVFLFKQSLIDFLNNIFG